MTQDKKPMIVDLSDEKSVKWNFDRDMSYGDYLGLEKILNAQIRRSDHHDEMLFVIIHKYQSFGSSSSCTKFKRHSSKFRPIT